jgi:hypothetical protein
MGKPARVCGCAWVEKLKSEWMRLIDVPKAIVGLVAVARGAVSPRASAHAEVIAFFRPRANEDASLMPGADVAGLN